MKTLNIYFPSHIISGHYKTILHFRSIIVEFIQHIEVTQTKYWQAFVLDSQQM